jgi:hypothetical protein
VREKRNRKGEKNDTMIRTTHTATQTKKNKIFRTECDEQQERKEPEKKEEEAEKDEKEKN